MRELYLIRICASLFQALSSTEVQHIPLYGREKQLERKERKILLYCIGSASLEGTFIKYQIILKEKNHKKIFKVIHLEGNDPTYTSTTIWKENQ